MSAFATGRRLASRRDGQLTDHQTRQRGFIGLGGRGLRDNTAAAQHRNSIRDGARLGKFVSDENDDSPFAAKSAQKIEKRGQLAGREDSGGFIEDQNARIETQRAQDLEADPLGDRSLGDDCARRRQLEAEMMREVARLRHHRIQIDSLAARGRSPSRPKPPSARFSSQVKRSNSIGL